MGKIGTYELKTEGDSVIDEPFHYFAYNESKGDGSEMREVIVRLLLLV